ncbi:MAG TPA: CPBP family intramembrane metalloprotease [Candidatus Paceibacterota bacterium]|nr:CPBP family intramembrane metalloprotease [Verrucomicrobiota bacterium]HSA09840.1 CPBP family intramembrane metalloprotease [Candidatus Paceibacterota bacterium]
MLSAKPWKVDTFIRLVLSVMVCAYAGSLLVSAQHYASAGAKVSSKFFFPLAAVALICLAVILVLASKPWPPEAYVRRLVTLMVCANGGLLVGAWVQRFSGVEAAGTSIGRMLVATLSFQGAGLVLIGRFLREQQTGWAEAFGFANRRRRALLLGVLAALVFLPVSWGLQQASALVMTHLPHFRLEPQEQLPVQALRVSLSWGGKLALGATAVLLAPVAEEMMFRGILYPMVKHLGFPRLALWGTSLLFAAVHLNVATFVPLMVLALVLTALYERTDNLLAPIAAHVLFNALNFGTLLLQQRYGGG